jgi:hypothetical protein
MFEIESSILMVWEDTRGGDIDLYAQRFDAWYNVAWAAAGVPVCTESGWQTDPKAVHDGTGGMIVTWVDNRSGNNDIYTQRIAPNGNRLWTAAGVPICTNATDQDRVRIVSDGDGGAIITWHDFRYGASDVDIYAQRVDGSGVVQWTADGVSICAYSSNQFNPEIITAGVGGAIIAWEDARVSLGERDIYAQMVDHDGVTQWTSGGEIVTTASSHQTQVKIVSDGFDGAVIAWQDYRNLIHYDIYAQRMNQDGTPRWTSNGEAVCTASDNQYPNSIVTDEDGGAIIIWDDFRDGNCDVYAQRMNRNGVSWWAANGSAIAYTGAEEVIFDAIPDGVGGAILCFTNDASGDEDIYMNRLDGESGSYLWGYSSTLVCGFRDDQIWPRLAPDGLGGAICTWHDFRNGPTSDLFAQKVESNGFWGYPCPGLIEVADVPHDQGGKVLLTWMSSRIDNPDEFGLEFYSIWRLLGGMAMQALENAGVKETPPDAIGPDFGGEAYRRVNLNGAMYGFEWLANVDAHYMSEYSYTAATLYDSTAVDPGLHTFMVSAHRDGDPETFWDSPPLDGYSVDNLSPCPPLALEGRQLGEGNGLELTWAPNAEDDLDGYNIYRGIGELYDPGPGDLLTTTCDTITVDEGWAEGPDYCYKVTAVDVHGNESGYAMFCSSELTGDDPAPVPLATFLEQNYPNPFNPVTTIAFGLRAGGHVSLRIYDAAGRLVTTLVDESRPAGIYNVEWNGLGRDGTQAASGVYFYRLTAMEFEETRKMILLR